MKKILFLLSFLVIACSFQAVAQKAQTKNASERAVMRAAAKQTPQQELKNLEHRLAMYKKVLKDPSYASQETKIKATININTGLPGIPIWNHSKCNTSRVFGHFRLAPVCPSDFRLRHTQRNHTEPNGMANTHGLYCIVHVFSVCVFCV